MRVLNFSQLLDERPRLIKNHNETLLVKQNGTCILYGLGGFNNPSNLPTYNTHNRGGVIVNFDSDLCVVHYGINDYAFGDILMDFLVAYFKSLNLNAIRDNNDVLVDGYKVASFMNANIEEVVYTAAHISIEVDLSIIQEVCEKPMIKVPKGLRDYGVTQSELIDLLHKVII